MTSTMTAGSTRARELYEDKSGAVMLTGLFMSCFLIGALWFVIGIGDTVVFRDKMQEAADHGAFTAAAMNAKGMNFIALCNLIMIAGTVIHLVLGLVSDIAGAAHAVCILATLGGDPECAIACFFGECPTWDAWNGAFKVWDGYFNGMKAGFKALHLLQRGASYIYPVAGSVEAYGVGKKYEGDKRHGNVNVVALSSGMIPGGAVRGLGKVLGGKATGEDGKAVNNTGVDKEGLLPIVPKEYGELCKKVVTVATNAGLNLIGLGKSVSGGGISGTILKVFNNIIGSGLKWRYCNDTGPLLSRTPMKWVPPPPLTGSGPGWDSFWGEKGFYVVYGPAENGNFWMQTWAMTIAPQLKDMSDSNVKLAGDKPSTHVKALKTEQPAGYFAQAEMYFDCDATWTTPACNLEDNALFAINWRARLRRLDYPQFASGIVGAGLDALTNMPAVKEAKEALGGKLGEGLGKVLGTSGLKQDALDKAVETLIDQLQEVVTGKVGGLAGALDPKLTGAYH